MDLCKKTLAPYKYPRWVEYVTELPNSDRQDPEVQAEGVTEVRAFEPADLDACYAISLATGLAGGNASHLYRDPRMMGHISVAAGALLEPDLTLVVRADRHRRLRRRHARHHRVRTGARTGLVAVAARAVCRSLQHPSASWTARPAPGVHDPSSGTNPASGRGGISGHLHMNLLPPAASRRRIEAAGEWLARAGSPAVHVGVNRANKRAALFWASRGFTELAVPGGRTLWMGRALVDR